MSNDEKDRELALLRSRRNKSAEWHRRMQQAESACAAALAGKPRTGSMSIGRALANAGAGHWRDRAEAAEAERDELAALLYRALFYVQKFVPWDKESADCQVAAWEEIEAALAKETRDD